MALLRGNVVLLTCRVVVHKHQYAHQGSEVNASLWLPFFSGLCRALLLPAFEAAIANTCIQTAARQLWRAKKTVVLSAKARCRDSLEPGFAQNAFRMPFLARVQQARMEPLSCNMCPRTRKSECKGHLSSFTCTSELPAATMQEREDSFIFRFQL